MKQSSSGSNLDANLEKLSLVYSFKHYICQDARIARAYIAQIQQ